MGPQGGVVSDQCLKGRFAVILFCPSDNVESPFRDQQPLRAIHLPLVLRECRELAFLGLIDAEGWIFDERNPTRGTQRHPFRGNGIPL